MHYDEIQVKISKEKIELISTASQARKSGKLPPPPPLSFLNCYLFYYN